MWVVGNRRKAILKERRKKKGKKPLKFSLGHVP
jgi:hypothetical protein